MAQKGAGKKQSLFTRSLTLMELMEHDALLFYSPVGEEAQSLMYKRG